MKTVEVTIAGHTLKLSPLAPDVAASFRETARILWGLDKPTSERGALLRNLSDVTGFIVLSARPSHPDISLEELSDEATAWEIYAAVLKLEISQGDREAMELPAAGAFKTVIDGREYFFAPLRLKELREMQKAMDVRALEIASGRPPVDFDLDHYKRFVESSMRAAGNDMPNFDEMDLPTATKVFAELMRVAMEASGTPFAPRER
jgi:hypothetical protein